MHRQFRCAGAAAVDNYLPVVHGDVVCPEHGAARVLMLTASEAVQDRVDGLTLGADDYLGKPFAFSELVARVRALGRRSAPATSSRSRSPSRSSSRPVTRRLRSASSVLRPRTASLTVVQLGRLL